MYPFLLSLARAPARAPARAFGIRSGERFPIAPHSKLKAKARHAVKLRTGRGSFFTLNDPAATAKFLRHAERIARELGVADEAAEFEEAAKAFPNAPPLIVATFV